MVRHAADAETRDATFRASLEDIRNGRWKIPVEKVRVAYATGGKDAADPLKKLLPALLFSGTFFYRSADKLKKRTPAICADMDHLPFVEATREQIIADPHVLAAFISPTGTGLKVVFKIDATLPHEESFLAAEHYALTVFGLQIDPACKDVNRLCFVSYDPDCFIANDALALPPAPVPPPPVPEERREPSRIRSNFQVGYISVIDDYNARGDWKALLLKRNWKESNEPYWTRPDKKEGISGSWGKVKNAFHCFTSSAPPLEAKKNYDPFDLYRVLECEGNRDDALKQLYDLGYGTRRKPKPEPPKSEDQHWPDSEVSESRPVETKQHGGNGETEPPPRREFAGEKFLKDVPPATDSAGNKPPPLLGADWPKPISAALACASPPPIPPELIAGILYVGGTLLLSGPSKSRKTFSALELCIAIATGTPWLGYKTTKSPALFINLELQPFAIFERIAKICAARGCPPPDNLIIWNLRGFTVSLDALTVQLPAAIQKLGIKIVGIDPIYKVSAVSGMEENSNDDQGKLLTLVEGLCVKESCALALTHHFAKGDASTKTAIDRHSGGGVYARWGDVIMTFTPHKQDDAMTVEMALRNFAPVAPFVVRWIYPRWVRDAKLDPEDLKTARGAKEQHPAASVLRDLAPEGMMYGEWLKATGLSESTFRRKRQDLIDDGKVEIRGNLYFKISD